VIALIVFSSPTPSAFARPIANFCTRRMWSEVTPSLASMAVASVFDRRQIQFVHLSGRTARRRSACRYRAKRKVKDDDERRDGERRRGAGGAHDDDEAEGRRGCGNVVDRQRPEAFPDRRNRRVRLERDRDGEQPRV